MNNSKTFDQAEKFFNENKDTLLNVMFEKLVEGVSVDQQTDHHDNGELMYDQIVLWGEGFNLCCQDSDMNGDGKGEAHYRNCGADSGFDDLLELLKKDDCTAKLHASDEVHENEYLTDFACLLSDKLVEHFNVKSMFLCNNDG